jgi:tetratricopeptide (TPR) repeat protein
LRDGRKQAILARRGPFVPKWRPPDGDDRAVIIPLQFRPAAIAVVAAVAVTGSGLVPAAAQTPTSYSRSSVSGSYLAARHAMVERDAAAASAYYRSALRGDPRNNELLTRAFLAVLSNGDVEEAGRLAEKVLQSDKTERLSKLVMGVRNIKQKQYQSARAQFTQPARGQPADLAAALLTAWTLATPNDNKAGVDAIEKLTGPDWYNVFKELHAGFIIDLTGTKRDAGRRYERAYKLAATELRVVQAYGNYLARQGNKDEALKVFKAFDELLPRHPLITEAISDISAGKRIAPLVDSPQAGAAEVLYGLGAVLARRGAEDLGLIYLQLALYLAPQHPMALISLADLYENVKKSEFAIKTYERIPATSPMHRYAQIQRALGLDTLDRTDEAKAILEKLIAEAPTELEAISALGNIMRGRKQFAECADVYSKGIDPVAKPERANWVLYYFRGICHERSKQWPKAEADFQKALELFPNQPLVLNYLGYSWVDQGVRLDEGMAMIRRAVDQRSDDGYIVDSLGWAYYRIGNYEEAVKNLDRAVELKPEDPTINDHLGDAYWKLGRELEARFQWSHARDLKPDDDELAKIEEKLKTGLPPAAADADKPKKPDGG